MSNRDNNNFVLLLGKRVSPYEYMGDWKKFNEKLLPEKEDFYNHLNMKDITDAHDAHAERVCKDFEIKTLGECHDLYVQSDILLLADAFEDFRNMCVKIYKLDPAKFLSASGLAWQLALNKTKVKLDLLTDIDMLLMVEKRYERRNMSPYSSIFKKLITNTWKIKIKIKAGDIFNTGMKIIYMVGQCRKSFQ